jgi:hypothetical protein
MDERVEHAESLWNFFSNAIQTLNFPPHFDGLRLFLKLVKMRLTAGRGNEINGSSSRLHSGRSRGLKIKRAGHDGHGQNGLLRGEGILFPAAEGDFFHQPLQDFPQLQHSPQPNQKNQPKL